MIFYFFLLIFASLFAESKMEWEVEMDAEEAAYEKYAGYIYELERAFADKMAEELNFFTSGPIRTTRKTIETLGMKFYVPRRTSIEEARALMLFVIDRYAEAINAHEKIQPFLETKPFSYKQIEISLTFEGADLSFADGTVHTVFNVSDYAIPENRNHFFYYAVSPCPRTTVEILKESREEVVQRNALAPIKNLAVHQATEKEIEIDRLLSCFQSDMIQKHRLECWAVGGDMANQIQEMGGHFVVLRPTTLKEARLLILDIAQNFLKTFNESEKIRPYLATVPFPINKLKLRVDFRKTTYFPYRDGSMESVKLEGGRLTYYREVPDKERKSKDDLPDAEVVLSESYEEALKASLNLEK